MKTTAAPNEAPTREQLVVVLEHIASRVDCLNRLLMALQESGGLTADDSTSILDGAQAIAANLGAVADRFAPSKFRDPDEWLFGNRFANAGKAGAA